ncbi:hypothetical protein E4U42_004140 [Claviceps africana]|uniref:Secreted protein n=1 Tax=Claviceps africana TaxID=83212 RepID=A0A8K0NL12_9HYPO|nr:hypothetical protein E4U42_004140 [Claviceps africana]
MASIQRFAVLALLSIQVSKDENASVVDRRDDANAQLIWWRDINCGEVHDWEAVRVGKDSAIGDGIKSLREAAKSGGVPKAGPGPNSCGRSPNEKALASWLNIADGAWQIVRKCVQGDTAKGQVFTDADWNVIVRKDGQDC